ncbi:MAG: threonine synthase, partial [Cyclobacteriaceae bacterium]
YLGLKQYLNSHSSTVGIFLETAHPVKFKDVVEGAIHQMVPIPERLNAFLEKEKQTNRMTSSFSELKQFLLLSL